MVDTESLPNRPPRSPGSFSRSESAGDIPTPATTPEPVAQEEGAVVARAVDIPVNEPTATKSSFGLKKVLLIVVGLLFLIGAGYYWWQNKSASFTPGQETRIDYWGLWEPESVMAGLIEEFEKENPKIKVNYTQQNIVDYRQRLQSALASGSGPDIFRIHNTWLPMFANDLAPVPNELASSLSLETNYYPVVKESLFVGGRFYGLPLMIDTLALFYNKEIFNQHQLSVPQDWDQFRQVANQLTIRDEKGRILQSGAAMGTASNVDHWSDILGLMTIQNGASIAGPYGIDAQQALDFFLIFAKQDQVWDQALPESTRAFAGGKLALYFAPSWRIINLNELNPNLDFGVVPVPQLPEREPISWATFWVEGVSVRSEKQAAAWQFLDFLSQEESLERIFKAGSQAHYVGQLYPKIDMAGKLKQDPLLAPFLEQAPYARSWYLSSRTADNGLNDTIIKYFEDAVNRSLMGANSEMETTVSQGVASVLSKYQVSQR
ncbi:MAG: extracellular solute-binding protein [Candidatus Shapirobacteria bacterium]|nr:extracellular solute-binding protein [Candidatus Shapirobacteria bacterium]MDD5073660.1 extracellular solute-binding protein [Candidatus Shapirobacteria bacterium]MDD5481379.1 extracellular solute-binding protein [Candidatus Shapirobacteria bacterium]